MAKFRIATPAGASFTVAGGGYGYELEALTPIDAEIYEIPAGSEDEFVAAAKDADALYAKGRPITKRMIDGLERCKIISLGSVGVDTVDVDAATAKGIPVTNCPDTFIEEVADHAMRLMLATHGRLVEQDRMVREGRWAEGRPALLQIPRLRGLTLGLIAFGHVARAVAERAKPFGLHIIAYDPFIEEMVMTERGVEPVSLPELLARADIISMHSPATASAQRMIREEHFRQMKKTAIYISTGRGPTTDEAALIKALDEGLIAGAGLDVLEKEPPGGNNRIVAGPRRQVADVLRQPDGARFQRPQALAAGLDGARPEFLERGRHSGAARRAEPGMTQKIQREARENAIGKSLGSAGGADPLSRPQHQGARSTFSEIRPGQCSDRAHRRRLPLYRRAGVVRRRALSVVERHPQ